MTTSKFEMVNLMLADICFTASLSIESACKKTEVSMYVSRAITCGSDEVFIDNAWAIFLYPIYYLLINLVPILTHNFLQKRIKMTNNKPLVSIVIPCYNHGNYVQESIQSVIDQDYDNIELIIIDDGSSDDSVTKIEEMIPTCQQRFKRFEFRYRPNKGLCATLNEALTWCGGKFFAPLASDDIILPHKVRVQAEHLNANKSCIGVFGKAELINEDSLVVGQNNNKVGKLFFKDIILVKNSVCAPTQMIRLNKLKSSGGYQQDFYI